MPLSRPFRRILVANRGEIALRICRAAHELGCETVAVFSPDDGARALHARCATQAVPLTPGSATGPAIPYLHQEQLLEVARDTGCDAVHPGYGFLSESAAFARRVCDGGLTWIGPPPAVLTLFGDKTRARALAQQLALPVIRGSPGSFVDAEGAFEYIRREGMGWPVLLKAAHGGGGRGIRLVAGPAELPGAFAAAAREAEGAFGAGELFVEEVVQILADGTGNVMHLLERDCSLQLNNQKVLELAPAPGMHPGLRQRLTSASLALAREAGYVGAGTVEWLVRGPVAHADAPFVFLEVNPRLQVEHTVTEEVTGVDLVQAQMRIAAGETLPGLGLDQASLERPRAQSLQLRINLARGGALGPVAHLREPSGKGVRVDSALYEGLSPSPHYDPLLSKVVVNVAAAAPFEALALKARAALDDLRVDGVDTNAGFLGAVLELPAFRENDVRTTTLSAHETELAAVAAEIQHTWAAARADGTGTPAAAPKRQRRRLGGSFEGEVAVPTPVAGAVLNVWVTVGQEVEAGEPLLTLTAMKMETTVTAPVSGVVAAVLDVVPGDVLGGGDDVATIRPADVTAPGAAVRAADPAEEEGWKGVVAELLERRRCARAQGGADRVAQHHAKGRLTLREKLDALLDAGTFEEVGPIAGLGERDEATGQLLGFTPANFLVGTGSMDGRMIVACGEDFTISGGSPNFAGLRKSIFSERLALQLELPLVRLHESGGGAPGDAGSHKGASAPRPPVYDTPRFDSIARCLGTVPVVTVASGSVAGLPASRFVAAHFAVMVRDACVLTAGPKVVARALGYEVTKEELGGSEAHETSGVPDNFAESEADAFLQVRQFLSYLPPNVHEPSPVVQCDEPEVLPPARAARLRDIVPGNRRQTYRVREVLELIVDAGSFFEIGTTQYGASQVTGLARLGGRSVGVMANDNCVFGGAMTADGADKVTKFLDLCRTFSLPVVAFVDEPGFMIGLEAERAGTIRRGTRAVLTAQTHPLPFCSVIIRKAYGVAAAAHLGGNGYVLAWPSAESGNLPVESGVAVAFARKIRESADPASARAALEARFAKALSPFHTSETFAVHDLILPEETRAALCTWLRRSEGTLRRRRWVEGKGAQEFMYRC